MRDDIPDESVDLIYLDPPFNSKRLYNAFIGDAQWVAFNDTWRWSEAVDDFHDVASDANLSPTVEGLRTILGEGPNLAYLSYMANRLRECWRVMKPTSSIYLHCDPTMSHYLKIVMDGIFGENAFLNEIVWKRMSSHNDAKRWGSIHDIILYYSKSGNFVWTGKARIPYSEEYINKAYRYEDHRGRYTTSPLQARSLSGGGYEYEFNGITDIWKFPEPKLRELEIRSLITLAKKTRRRASPQGVLG